MKSIVLAIACTAIIGCGKPSEESCRKAITNMRALLGTDNLDTADLSGEIRSCKGGSTKDAVECAARATSLEELAKCEFMQLAVKEDQCPKALANARTLRGESGPAPADDLRRCKNVSRKKIACAIAASSIEELDKCGFVPRDQGSGSNR